MRIYFYVNNLYMSEKQWGLQSVHVLGEMIKQYAQHPKLSVAGAMFDMVFEWAAYHKTVIFLQGINSGTLQQIYNELNHAQYPLAKFHEDQESLGGALTAVGMVVPTHVCDMVDTIRESDIRPMTRPHLQILMQDTVTESDFQLAMYLSQGRLA